MAIGVKITTSSIYVSDNETRLLKFKIGTEGVYTRGLFTFTLTKEKLVVTAKDFDGSDVFLLNDVGERRVKLKFVERWTNTAWSTVILVLIMMVILMFLTIVAPPVDLESESETNTLEKGYMIPVGYKLTSLNKVYTLHLENSTGCVLVITKTNTENAHQRQLSDRPCSFLAMQNNHYLVAYDRYFKPVWEGPAFFGNMLLTNNGEVKLDDKVLFAYPNTPRKESETSILRAGEGIYGYNTRGLWNEKYYVTMDSHDFHCGITVKTTKDNKDFRTITLSREGPCNILGMQTDGNLVAYNKKFDSSMWASNTVCRSCGNYLELTKYGSLHLKNKDGKIIAVL